MDNLEEKFKYITKIKDNCWLVQSRKESRMEAFTVCLENGHIIMTGDYDGLMVRPYGAGNLIGWMRGATTLSYFAEKVRCANQYHKCEEYSEDVARANIAEIKELFIEEFEGEELERESKKFDDLVSHKSLECEHEYWSLLQDLEYELEMNDLYEYSPYAYTSQLKWQHKCLLFWANKVAETETKKVVEANE